MGRFVDISGKRFGRLTAIRPTQGRDSGGRVLWEFMCDCGTTKVIRPNGVIEGRVQSCGCLHKEKAAQQGRSKRTHGREPQKPETFFHPKQKKHQFYRQKSFLT